MTAIDKYNLTCFAYSIAKPFMPGNFDKHHILPKSIYPQHKDKKENIINVPDVVHFALHEWLNEHLKETNNNAYEKLKYADVATFANNRSEIKIDFSKKQEILDLIWLEVSEYLVNYNNSFRVFHADEKSFNELLNKAFVFCGGYFYHIATKADGTFIVPESLQTFIKINCTYRTLAPSRFYGRLAVQMKLNKKTLLPELLHEIEANGYKAVRTSANSTAERYGLESIPYIELNKPFFKRPDNSILANLHNVVAEKFPLYQIADISFNNIHTLIAELVDNPLEQI